MIDLSNSTLPGITATSSFRTYAVSQHSNHQVSSMNI
jgi:hypothetical protein